MINYWAVAYLESCLTSMMEIFWENNQRPKTLTFFITNARLGSKYVSDWKGSVNVGVGGLRVHGLVHREVLEARLSHN